MVLNKVISSIDTWYITSIGLCQGGLHLNRLYLPIVTVSMVKTSYANLATISYQATLG